MRPNGSIGLYGLVDEATVIAPAHGRQLALELAELALQLPQRLCRLTIHWPSLAIWTVELSVRRWRPRR